MQSAGRHAWRSVLHSACCSACSAIRPEIHNNGFWNDVQLFLHVIILILMLWSKPFYCSSVCSYIESSSCCTTLVPSGSSLQQAKKFSYPLFSSIHLSITSDQCLYFWWRKSIPTATASRIPSLTLVNNLFGAMCSVSLAPYIELCMLARKWGDCLGQCVISSCMRLSLLWAIMEIKQLWLVSHTEQSPFLIQFLCNQNNNNNNNKNINRLCEPLLLYP